MKFNSNYFITNSIALVLTAGSLGIFMSNNTNKQDDESMIISQSENNSVIKGDVQTSWLENVKEEILSTGYLFHKEDKNHFIAYNPSKGLKTVITPNQMLVSGNVLQYEWAAAIKFQSISSKNIDLPIGNLIEMKLVNANLHVVFENITIEYVNSESGLRQNFIINNAIESIDQISINLKISSTLNSHVSNNSMVLTHNGLQLFKYSDLKVWDKNGSIQQATMSLKNELLSLNVDLENAEFPLTIDPLSTTYAWKGTGGKENSSYGFWVCGNGDLNGDGFGDIIIGAPDYTNTFASEGAVYVYYGSASGLPVSPSWSKFGGQAGGSFGRCVSIEGDVNNDGYDDVLIGASNFDAPTENEGKIFLYLGGSTGVAATPVFTYESNRKSAKFGDAVSIVGDLNGDGFDDVVIGAKAWDDNEVLGADVDSLGNKAGKFWVFHGNATGVNTVPAMECVGNTTDANLGVSVDGAGDVNGDGYGDINIGGYIFLIGDGMICTFHGGPTGCDNIPDFMAVGGAEDTSFFAVNLSQTGDINGDGYTDVIIGMPRYDTYGVYNAGKIQIHYGSASGLTAPIFEMFGEGQYNERWGYNVNDAGDINNDGYDDILLTAKNYSPTGGDDSIGRTYFYLGGPNGPSPVANWTFEGESISGIGTNASGAGDVNGDGRLDIIASGDGYTGDFSGEGAAYVFYGIDHVCDPPINFVNLGVGPTVATLSWDWTYGASQYKLYLKKLGSAAAPLVVTSLQSSVTITGLSPASTYKCYVKAKCQAGWTPRSSTLTFTTPPLKENDAVLQVVSMYPNPVQDILNINTGNIFGNTTIRIFDAKGNLVLEKNYTTESTELIKLYEVSELEQGIYFVEISNGIDRVVNKINKSK